MDIVKDRLVASRLVSVDFVPTALRQLSEKRWCPTVATHVNELLAIANGSHALNDNALQTATGCIISDDQQAQQVQDGARFYIRSLTLTAGQLGVIINDYDHFYADSALATAFRKHIVSAWRKPFTLCIDCNE